MPTMPGSISFARPDDWHQHLREDDAIDTPLAHAASQFGRIMVMPNLHQPITNATLLGNYLTDIALRMPANAQLEVFGTLYLQPGITPETIAATMRQHPLLAVKWYPRGVTTNSAEGVANIESCYPVFAALEELQLVLSIHGEVNDPTVDIFDREAVFIQDVLVPLLARFPALRVVLEHISTKASVECVRQYPADRVAATITAHHLLINRHHMLANGIKPHLYCLPIVKRENDRIALLEAATSGDPRFFLGSDSAPHPQNNKETSCGCAGCYTGAHAIELYAQAFDSVGKIAKLADFANRFGADFYRLPDAGGEISIEPHPHTIPASYRSAGEPLIPFWANQQLHWRVATP